MDCGWKRTKAIGKLEGTHRAQTSITEVNKFYTHTGLVCQSSSKLVKNFNLRDIVVTAYSSVRLDGPTLPSPRQASWSSFGSVGLVGHAKSNFWDFPNGLRAKLSELSWLGLSVGWIRGFAGKLKRQSHQVYFWYMSHINYMDKVESEI